MCDSQCLFIVILSVAKDLKGEAQREKEIKSERRMPRLSGGEERRGKLRKGSGICKQELIRACLNGATHLVEDQVPSVKTGRTRGTETS